ncbi:hypothetical protein C8Q76DRAFT_716284 [Earliella scabrosa]|nr:hypothetical protein C8Q76DRAFT_716284 [Earliella scabrosa]
MRICYPIVKPKSRAFKDIEPILQAALKYEMELPVATLSDELLSYAPQFPLTVWAVACRTGLEEVARRAAELMLPLATLDIPSLEDMDGIHAGHVFRLHEFHRLRGKVDFAFKLLSPPLSDVHPAEDDAPAHGPVTNVPNPDVILTSSDEVEFPVHRGVISVASPLLQAKVDEAVRATVDASNEPSSGTVALPKVQLDVTARALAPLLKLCYPGEAEIPSDPAHLVDLLLASERLDMGSVRRTVSSRWSAAAKPAPLRAFLLAAGAGLSVCAKQAATHVLETAFEGVYLREMEHSPGLPYHRLLMHYRSCREIAKSILSDVTGDLEGDARGTYSRTSTPSYQEWDGYQRSMSGTPAPPIIIQPVRYPPYYPPPVNHGNAWFKTYMKEVSDNLEQQPGRVAATTEELIEATSDARKWCSSCQSLATNVCRVGKALREIPLRVKEVEFEL